MRHERPTEVRLLTGKLGILGSTKYDGQTFVGVKNDG